jgi:hypothetical protein
LVMSLMVSRVAMVLSRLYVLLYAISVLGGPLLRIFPNSEKVSMKRKRFLKAKVWPKRTGRIVTRMGKKWSKDPAPLWHKSELQTRIQSYKLGVGWGIQKCPRKQNKTIVREPVLFLSKYRTDVDSTKIVTRMLVTPIQ